MDHDICLCWLSLSLQAFGWIAFAVSKCSRSRWGVVIGDALLVSALVGLGTTVLVAASAQHGCALVTGLNAAVLLVAALGQIACELNPSST